MLEVPEASGRMAMASEDKVVGSFIENIDMVAMKNNFIASVTECGNGNERMQQIRDDMTMSSGRAQGGDIEIGSMGRAAGVLGVC